MNMIVFTILLLFLAFPAFAQDSLLIASGAGYKPVVEALAKTYAEQTGTAVERIYGNMAEIMSQAKNSGKVDLIIGEESFLRNASMPLAEFTRLGQGRMVLAWPKGKTAPEDLKNKSVQRIAVPDAERAIYGKAAMEYLNHQNVYEKIKSKLLVVGTVPQVFTYLSTGEVDVGFLNLTQALAGKNQLGGFTELDPATYSPIHIACFKLRTSLHQDIAADFLNFLQADQTQNLLHEAGL